MSTKILITVVGLIVLISLGGYLLKINKIWPFNEDTVVFSMNKDKIGDLETKAAVEYVTKEKKIVIDETSLELHLRILLGCVSVDDTVIKNIKLVKESETPSSKEGNSTSQDNTQMLKKLQDKFSSIKSMFESMDKFKKSFVDCEDIIIFKENIELETADETLLKENSKYVEEATKKLSESSDKKISELATKKSGKEASTLETVIVKLFKNISAQ